MEFNAKKIVIFGTGGSGKTVYAKDLWKRFNCPMAYDISNEFEKLDSGISYIPKDTQSEIVDFIKFFTDRKRKKKIDALFFDDCDIYLNEHTTNIPIVRDIIIRYRNLYDVAVVFISKRPQNIPTIISNNANILITFKMEGFNAINRLKDIDTSIYDLLPKLNENPYSYVMKREGEGATFNSAITP